MARQLKTHIRSPVAKKESLCQRMSVDFVKKNSEATCLTCRSMAVDGQLRTLEFEANAAKWEGYNNTGEPRYTEMQVKFSQHPQVMTNARVAAVESGYSEVFSRTKSVGLRKQLAPLIMEYQEKAKSIAAISIARIQTELASMGFANVLDYFNIAEDGSLQSKQLNELTRAQASAIQEVKVVERQDPVTGEIRFVIGWLKLADKRANLVELGRTLGMFNKIALVDKRESELMLQEVPTDALEKAEDILMSAVKIAREQKSKNQALPGEFTKLPEPSEVKE
ncbi:hypothetical protein LCGC14_0373390 [marine sediment metagenome]|uniref:Terminase small subunit n=1 Tax=marine sediment metagenome TaxID=412755 RepID=A0A0F9TAB4_9ZZZZ